MLINGPFFVSKWYCPLVGARVAPGRRVTCPPDRVPTRGCPYADTAFVAFPPKGWRSLVTVSLDFRRLQHSNDIIQFVYTLRRFLQQVEVIQNTIELHSARGKLNGSFIGL